MENHLENKMTDWKKYVEKKMSKQAVVYQITKGDSREQDERLKSENEDTAIQKRKKIIYRKIIYRKKMKNHLESKTTD